MPVTLRLAAGTDRLELELANPLGPDGGSPAGGGRGLRGIGERVAMLGGRMTAGADGTSWRVTVSLPLRPGPGPTIPEGSTPGASPSIRVLIADDEALIRTGLRAIIEPSPT